MTTTYIVGGKRKFKTLEEAKAYANHVWLTKGHVLSIEIKG